MQDAFVNVWRRPPDLSGDDRLPAYLRSAVLNGARSHLRHRGVERRHLRAVATPSAAPEARADTGDDARVLAALRSLPAPSARGAGAPLLPRPLRGRDRHHARHLRRRGEDPCPSWPRHAGRAVGGPSMTPEDRLRQAMESRASRVEPSPDGLSRIEEKLMDAQRSDNRKRLLLGLGAAAAVVAVVLGVRRADRRRRRGGGVRRHHHDHRRRRRPPRRRRPRRPPRRSRASTSTCRCTRTPRRHSGSMIQSPRRAPSPTFVGLHATR